MHKKAGQNITSPITAVDQDAVGTPAHNKRASMETKGMGNWSSTCHPFHSLCFQHLRRHRHTIASTEARSAHKNVHINIAKTYIFESNADSIKMCTALRSTTNYPGQVFEFTDAAIYPHIASTIDIPSDVKIISLTGTPCTSISRGARFATRKHNYDLHGHPSNVWWNAHAGHVALQRRVGNRLLTFGENVVPANHIDMSELDATAGHRNSMITLPSEGAQRSRIAWSSIAYAEPDTTIIVELPSNVLPFPFQFDVDHTTRRNYPTLRTIIPSRMYELAQPPHTIQKYEEEQLKKFFVYDTSKRKYVLPPMSVLGHLMAVPIYVIQAFQQVHPCAGTVQIITHNLVQRQSCGEQVWCEGCSTIASALGSAWNLSTTARHLMQMISTYAFFLDFPEDWTETILDAEMFRFPTQCHQCTPTCKYNRQHL